MERHFVMKNHCNTKLFFRDSCVLAFFFLLLSERRFKKTAFAGGRGLPLCQKWAPTPTPESWILLCAGCPSGRYESQCPPQVCRYSRSIKSMTGFEPKGQKTTVLLSKNIQLCGCTLVLRACCHYLLLWGTITSIHRQYWTLSRSEYTRVQLQVLKTMDEAVGLTCSLVISASYLEVGISSTALML